MKDLKNRIETWLASIEPGSRLLRVWSLGGGTSSGMTAFRFSSRGETRTLVLRQPNDWTLENRPGTVRNEFRRLRALHQGHIAVPHAVFCDESGAVFGRPGLVIDYIKGRPEFEPGDMAQYLRQYTRQLADIHHFDLTNKELVLLEAPAIDIDPRADDRIAAAEKIYRVDCIYAALTDHAGRTSGNDEMLLHGDYWPGNTLWRDGSLVAVIDWEEATRGDPLHDLSIARLDLWFAFGRGAAQAFTEYYQALNPIDMTLLPLWDLRAALRPVGNLEVWATCYGPMGRPDITLDRMKAAHIEFVDQAFEALRAL
ncbi:MAG: phosphotransferase [Opitutaceae bacterium]